MVDRSSPSGVLVVDKPEGPTSHDVVGRMRRALGTKRVGHAGTLDPMASGVLVVLVGEATKLEPYLSSSDKSYEAAIAFGRSTDTLDRLGTTTSESAPSPALLEELERIDELSMGGAELEVEGLRAAAAPLLARALEVELARLEQIPPRFSAIKVAGRKGYDRARGGEDFELAARPVRLLEARVVGARRPSATLSLRIVVSKGYYVRALARDLGESLGAPGMLTALRRTRSGAFGLEKAVGLESPPASFLAALLSLEDAIRGSLAVSKLTAEGVLRARRGQPLSASDFALGIGCSGAWLDPAQRLVAMGTFVDGVGQVQRGFVSTDRGSAPDEPDPVE